MRYVFALVVAAGLAAAASALHDAAGYGRGAAFAVASGAAFGVILQRSRLCFASAFRDLFLLRDRRSALAVVAALGAGSVGYQVVFGAWVPDPRAGFAPPTAHIAPAGWHLLLGGGAFGLGMVLAGGCVSGQLYRLGEGALTAAVALTGSIGGFWGGFAAWNRLYVTTVATAPLVWLPRSLGYAGSLALQIAVLSALAAWLLHAFPARSPAPTEPLTLRVAWRRLAIEGWPAGLGGAAVGVLATFTFLRATPLGVTSELARVARVAGSALGLVPVRLEGLDLLAGCRPAATDRAISDNGLFVLALVLGSCCAALVAGEFRLRLGGARAQLRALVGGVLLGFGAMISLGCTVGTLLSGVMAFSLSGWVFLAGLLGGSRVGVIALRRLA